jgi:DtxR family transcriptional regulator, manganese transport regulator
MSHVAPKAVCCRTWEVCCHNRGRLATERRRPRQFVVRVDTLSIGTRGAASRVCQGRHFLPHNCVVVKHTKSRHEKGEPLARPVSQRETAANQLRTRQQHAQERAQDYVEAIAELITANGEARATDLAKSLGVTHVTVIRTVQRLQRNGLVTSLPYRSIFLTEAGRKLASKARSRHKTVVAFLEALGISSAVARADAEGIEHHVSPETLAAFERFLAERAKPPE